MTNLEAADEVARQMRLRDIGGLIVIDFIDMSPAKNQREVENRLREALKLDRARVQVGRISRFGLLEMSRQRLRPSLGESSQIVCPRCNGQGTIRGVESLALSIMRVIEEEAMKDNTARVIAQLPVDTATYLLNEKRTKIDDIQKRHKTSIVLVPNLHLETPHYEVIRVRESEMTPEMAKQASFELTQMPEGEVDAGHIPQARQSEAPAIKTVIPELPRPVAPAPVQEGPGLFVRLWRALFGTGTTTQKKASKDTPRQSRPQSQRGRKQQQQRRRPNQNRRQQQPPTDNKAPAAESKPTNNKPAANETRPAESGDAQQQAGPGSSSRRGRRGGRRRRGNRNPQGGNEQQGNQEQSGKSDSPRADGNSNATDNQQRTATTSSTDKPVAAPAYQPSQEPTSHSPQMTSGISSDDKSGMNS